MSMSTMYHGTEHYAVYGRKVGTFGGKAAQSTLRIHNTHNCEVILAELTRDESVSFRYAVSQRPDRDYIESQLIAILVDRNTR
jgi:hypothetical protein